MVIKINKENLLFYMTFIIWFTIDLIAQTTIGKSLGIPVGEINEVVDRIALILLIVQIVFRQRYNSKELAIIVALLSIVTISAVNSENYKMLSLCLFIVAGRGCDIRRIISMVYHVMIPVTLGAILLTLGGVIEDETQIRSSTGLLRHSLGFSHPNVLGVVIFQLVLCYVILHENMLLKQLVVTGAAVIFDYIVPNSQSPTFLLAVLFIILPIHYFSIKKLDGVNRFSIVLVYLAAICNILSIFVTVVDFSKYSFLNNINYLISTRFLYARRAFLESGFKIFGQTIYTLEEERHLVGLKGHLYLDTAYSVLLIRYGLVIYIVFSVAYIALMLKQIEKGNDLLLVLLFIFAVYGVMESSLFMLKYNFLLLLFSELIYADRTDFYIKDNELEMKKAIMG